MRKTSRRVAGGGLGVGRVGGLAATLALAVSAASCIGLPAEPPEGTLGHQILEGEGEHGSADLASAARIWQTSAELRRCGPWSTTEDYSSGRYNVHRYRVTLPVGGTTRVRFVRTAGAWAPAIVVVDLGGAAVYDGGRAGDHPSVRAEPLANGYLEAVAEVELEAAAAVVVNVYVTSWGALESGFVDGIPRDARYGISMTHLCPDDEVGGGSPHDGIERDGVAIPRAGLSNPTLRRALGISVEPHGDVVTHEGLRWVAGRVSWFGGPRDTGVSSTETGAITGERLRSLNSPLAPSADDLALRPGDFYFAAMRFDYAPAGVAFWREARLLVVNPASGAAVVVRPVDWGPNTRTRRVLDLSPQAMADLGLVTDGRALVAFARPGAALGPAL